MNANSTTQCFSWDVEMASENYFAHLTACQTEGSVEERENEKEWEMKEGCGKREGEEEREDKVNRQRSKRSWLVY